MCNQSVGKLLKRVRLQILEMPSRADLKQMCESADSHSKPEVLGSLMKSCFKNIGVITRSYRTRPYKT
jgi:hypothetical protein